MENTPDAVPLGWTGRRRDCHDVEGMLIRNTFAALLLTCALVPLQAQERPGSLEEAERAFADALVRHDRAAFVALFAPDAESSLPVVKQGAEAIANSWLPFLVDPGTTMLLTSASVTTVPAGDTGTSAGTLAVRGRTDKGVQTIPLGSYSIAWRLIDGRWKISKLSGNLESKPESKPESKTREKRGRRRRRISIRHDASRGQRGPGLQALYARVGHRRLGVPTLPVRRARDEHLVHLRRRPAAPDPTLDLRGGVREPRRAKRSAACLLIWSERRAVSRSPRCRKGRPRPKL